MTFEARQHEHSAELLRALEHDLRQATAGLADGAHRAMADMTAYHFGWQVESPGKQGKRVRPLLTLWACQAAGGDWQTALPAATAVELVHNFSLIHDDIEDCSQTRRGRPTLWAAWGMAQALNTGDALLALSQCVGQRLLDRGVVPEQAQSVQNTLNQACLRLTQGQHLDLAFEAREAVSMDEYLLMVEGKTASLLAAATQVGAVLAGQASASQVEAYRLFGHHLGMAFQIQDDILGVWGTPETTGKPAGDDLRSRKKTLPVVHALTHSAAFASLWNQGASRPQALKDMIAELEVCGALDRARELSADHTRTALQQLEKGSPAEPAATELRHLASSLLGRER